MPKQITNKSTQSTDPKMRAEVASMKAKGMVPYAKESTNKNQGLVDVSYNPRKTAAGRKADDANMAKKFPVLKPVALKKAKKK